MVRRLSQKLIFGICQNLIVKHISHELYQDILSQKEHAKHKVEVVMSFWQSEFYLAILYLFIDVWRLVENIEGIPGNYLQTAAALVDIWSFPRGEP